MNADQALLARWREGDDPAVVVNPLAQLLGMRILAIYREARTIRLGFEPPASERDAVGFMTTTAVAAMLDFACGFPAIVALVPSHTVASSMLHLEWVDRCRAATVEAVGAIEARNATTVFVTATLFDPDGRTIALARSTLRVRPTAA